MTRVLSLGVARALLPHLLAASIVGHYRRTREACRRAADVARVVAGREPSCATPWTRAVEAEAEGRWSDAAKLWREAARRALNDAMRERFEASALHAEERANG